MKKFQALFNQCLCQVLSIHWQRSSVTPIFGRGQTNVLWPRDSEKEVGMALPHLEKNSIQHRKTVSDMEPIREKKKGTAMECLAPRPGCRSLQKLTGIGWGQLLMVEQNRHIWPVPHLMLLAQKKHHTHYTDYTSLPGQVPSGGEALP